MQLNPSETKELDLRFEKIIQTTKEILGSKHPNRGNNRVVFCTKENHDHLVDWHIWSIWKPGEVQILLRRELKLNGISVQIDPIKSHILERGI